jgi:hypothetical protein
VRNIWDHRRPRPQTRSTPLDDNFPSFEPPPPRISLPPRNIFGSMDTRTRQNKKPRQSLDLHTGDEPSTLDQDQATTKVVTAQARLSRERDEHTTSCGTKEEQKPKTTFRALGNVVLAMQRFKNSLNPTYTYGKRTPSPTSSLSRSTGECETGDSQTIQHQHQQYAYSDRGHRSSLLLAPLPKGEEE